MVDFKDTGPYASFCFISISLSNLQNIVKALNIIMVRYHQGLN